MRPTRLELEGFISFRDRTEIDFSSLDLFGITGPTGAGKTALIDSMIFALYGKTPRLGEKGTQELISQGAPQLKVLLEFECGHAAYRVLRIVKRKGPGRAQIERQRDGEWEPIANSTRELRERVEEIVGLDFDGFTKTVVLPQGQFDRFLRGDGAARRKILSDLLGLDVYEQMMRRANEIARDANRQCDVLTEMAAQQYGSATPERLAELDAAIAEAVVEQRAAASEVASLEKALPFALQLRQTETDLARYQTERARLRKSLEAAAAQVGQARRRIETMRADLGSIGYDAQRHLEVTSLLPQARRRAELAQSIAALGKRVRSHSEAAAKLTRESETARAAWQAATAALNQAAQDSQHAEQSWQQFRTRHGSADLLLGAARDAASYAKIQSSLESLRGQTVATQKSMTRASKEAETLALREPAAREMVSAARNALDKLRLLHAASGVRRLLQQGEPCPVCLHPVEGLPPGDEGHASLTAAEENLASAEAALERLRSELAANRAETAKLRTQLDAEAERIRQLEESNRAIASTVERLSGAAPDPGQDPAAILKDLASQARKLETDSASAVRSLREATSAETALRIALHESETRFALARQAQASAARELEERQSELAAASAATSVELSTLEAEAKALAEARASHERLMSEQSAAERAASKAEVDERSVSERLALTEATLASLAERVNELHGQLEGLPPGEGIEVRLADSRARLQKIESALGSARLARKTISDQAREAEELARRVALLGTEAAVYSRLGSMLRTDQFVAWILKDAFARLAYEGSRQLEALSNGRYTFAAGGDDFAVCDRWNAGERRSVNTLSGGESFLASLSLALALSRGLPELAANRDRFHLDSLFLDEGFSTLDAETLDTVLGAVEMLQEDCRLIGVISHAPELAERLPGRIEVVKGANGSRVVVR